MKESDVIDGIKAPEIKIKYGRNIQLKKFNQLVLEITIEGSPEDDETPEQAVARLWKIARESVYEQYLDIINGGSNVNNTTKKRINDDSNAGEGSGRTVSPGGGGQTDGDASKDERKET